MVVSSLISYSQLWLNQCHNPNLSPGENREIVQKACNCGMDALKIFELSPAKGSLDNMSFVFQGYSMMSLSINCGAMNGANLPGNRSLADVESDCATNFAKESQFQVFHYCRALAMKAGALAKVQKFNDAFSVLEGMKALYDPELHTKAIMDAYGTDHCATMLALGALWHQHLNQTEKALRVCEYVIELILPAVAETNTNNSNALGLNYLLYPIIRVLASQDREGVDRAYEIYNTHVVKPFEAGIKRTGPSPWIIFPIKIILTCCSIATDRYNVPVKYDGLEEDVKWMLNGKTKVVDAFDTDTTNRFSLSIYSLLADACLQLMKRVEISSHTQRKLIEEGLRYSALADPKMKDKDGNVTNHIAYNFNTNIYSQFRMDKCCFRGTVGLITNRIVEGQQEPTSVHTRLQDCVLHEMNNAQLQESVHSTRSSIGSIIDIVEGQQEHGIEDIPV